MAIHETVDLGDVSSPEQEQKTARQAIEELRTLVGLEIPQDAGLISVFAVLVTNRVPEKFLGVAKAYRTSPPSDKTPSFSMDSRIASGDSNIKPQIRIVNYGNANEPHVRTTAVHIEPATGPYADHHIDLLLPVDADGHFATHSFPEATISKEVVTVINQNGYEQELRTRRFTSYRPGWSTRYDEDDPRILTAALQQTALATVEFLDNLELARAQS